MQLETILKMELDKSMPPQAKDVFVKMKPSFGIQLEVKLLAYAHPSQSY